MDILNDTNDELVVIEILMKLSKSEYSKGNRKQEYTELICIYINHLR